MKKAILAVTVAGLLASSFATAGFRDRSSTRGDEGGEREVTVVFGAEALGYCGVSSDAPTGELSAKFGFGDTFLDEGSTENYAEIELVNSIDAEPVTVMMFNEKHVTHSNPIDLTTFSTRWSDGTNTAEYFEKHDTEDLPAGIYKIFGKTSLDESAVAKGHHTINVTYQIDCPSYDAP